MKVEIPRLYCKRCRHSWHPRQLEIRICPKCKSPYWDKERKHKSKNKGRKYVNNGQECKRNT